MPAHPYKSEGVSVKPTEEVKSSVEIKIQFFFKFRCLNFHMEVLMLKLQGGNNTVMQIFEEL